MCFDFNDDKVKVSMMNYIDKLLSDFHINRSSENSTHRDNKLLKNSDQIILHSGTAKLLYRAVRVKPENSLFSEFTLHSSEQVYTSTKQSIVAKSSTEAELIACANSVSFAYSNKQISKITIYQDNQSTIKLLNNNRPTSQNSKHID
jgi:hypothetical protein